MLFFVLQFDNENNKAFFTELYEKYERKLFRIAFKICGNQWISEDAVHDTFCKAALNFDYIRTLSERHLAAWLVIVCKNRVLDILRKEAHFAPPPDNISDIAPETPETQFAYTELVDAIKSLPDNQRTLLEMKYVEGRTHKEIASALGISDTAVRLRILRAKQTLAKLIEKGESYEIK